MSQAVTIDSCQWQRTIHIDLLGWSFIEFTTRPFFLRKTLRVFPVSQAEWPASPPWYSTCGKWNISVPAAPLMTSLCSLLWDVWIFSSVCVSCTTTGHLLKLCKWEKINRISDYPENIELNSVHATKPWVYTSRRTAYSLTCDFLPVSLFNSSRACLVTSGPLYSFCTPQWTVHCKVCYMHRPGEILASKPGSKTVQNTFHSFDSTTVVLSEAVSPNTTSCSNIFFACHDNQYTEIVSLDSGIISRHSCVMPCLSD